MLVHKSCEDESTTYIDLFGIRIIFRNGRYDGWYNAKLKKILK